MASKGRRRKLPNGLTPKENAFKDTVLKQIAEKGEMNGTQAALEVYDTTDPETASAIATKNMSKVSIREQIENALSTQGLDPQSMLKELAGIAQSPIVKVSGETKLKAITEVLKLHNAYPDKKTGNTVINNKILNISYSEAKDRLSEMGVEASEFIKDAD